MFKAKMTELTESIVAEILAANPGMDVGTARGVLAQQLRNHREILVAAATGRKPAASGVPEVLRELVAGATSNGHIG